MCLFKFRLCFAGFLQIGQLNNTGRGVGVLVVGGEGGGGGALLLSLFMLNV
jgi:hypothetical protein